MCSETFSNDLKKTESYSQSKNHDNQKSNNEHSDGDKVSQLAFQTPTSCGNNAKSTTLGILGMVIIPAKNSNDDDNNENDNSDDNKDDDTNDVSNDDNNEGDTNDDYSDDDNDEESSRRQKSGYYLAIITMWPVTLPFAVNGWPNDKLGSCSDTADAFD